MNGVERRVARVIVGDGERVAGQAVIQQDDGIAGVVGQVDPRGSNGDPRERQPRRRDLSGDQATPSASVQP